MNTVHALKLKYHSVFNKKIEAIAAVHLNSFVNNRDDELSFETKATELEFMAKALLVYPFKQPWTNRSVNLNRSSDDYLCKIPVAKFPCSARRSKIHDFSSEPAVSGSLRASVSPW